MNLDIKQNWEKLGRFIETGKSIKGVEIRHSMDPSVCHVNLDRYRAYFSNRNSKNQSVIYSTDFSLPSPIETVHFNPDPVLLLANSELSTTTV